MLLLRSTILVFGLMLSCGINLGSPATSGILCGHSHCGVLVSRTEAALGQAVGGLTKPAVPADKAKTTLRTNLVCKLPWVFGTLQKLMPQKTCRKRQKCNIKTFSLAVEEMRQKLESQSLPSVANGGTARQFNLMSLHLKYCKRMVV